MGGGGNEANSPQRIITEQVRFLGLDEYSSVFMVNNRTNLSYLLINLGDIMSKYCPYKYRYQLIQWICDNTKWNKSTINKLTRMQLYAIWYKMGDNKK